MHNKLKTQWMTQMKNIELNDKNKIIQKTKQRQRWKTKKLFH